MEEVEIRIAETKKDTLDFKRDVIVGAEDPATGKVQADKVRGAAYMVLAAWAYCATYCHPPGGGRARRLNSTLAYGWPAA